MQIQNSKKQQKERESEEQGKRKSTEGGRGEEGGKMEMEDKENGAEEGGENLRRREVKERGGKILQVDRGSGEDAVAVLKSRRSLNFPRSDVRLVKSPTVKITRLPPSLSRKREGGFAKPVAPQTGKNKVANLQTKASKNSSRGPLVQQTAVNVTNQNQAVEEGVVTSLAKGTSRTTCTTEIFESGMQENDADMSQEVGGDSSIAMECSSSLLSPSTPPHTGNSEGLSARGAGSGSVSSPALRRSPRLKKRLPDTKKENSSHHLRDGGSDAKKKRKSDMDKKKEKSLKAVSNFVARK